MSRQLISVQGAELDVNVWGSGEPIVFVQTALTADELRPLASAAALEHGYRKILYHRRGYADSSVVDGPGSVARDAADCRALLSALAIDRAHVVGVSYSAAVALRLAADAPACVQTLVVQEPPPLHTPSEREFRAANDRLMRTRRVRGAAVALDEFLSMVVGPDWRVVMDDVLPGSVTQMQRDAVTFFDTDIPALLAWQFGCADARRVTCPLLHVGGAESGPWFADVRDLILQWFPQAEDVIVEGADHTLPLTHVAELADAVAAFLRRHPVGKAST